jgi:hypothetical protein
MERVIPRPVAVLADTGDPRRHARARARRGSNPAALHQATARRPPHTNRPARPRPSPPAPAARSPGTPARQRSIRRLRRGRRPRTAPAPGPTDRHSF